MLNKQAISLEGSVCKEDPFVLVSRLSTDGMPRMDNEALLHSCDLGDMLSSARNEVGSFWVKRSTWARRHWFWARVASASNVQLAILVADRTIGVVVTVWVHFVELTLSGSS